uniref:Uncharacterized protein n=1 Tax=Romanomermis culicivorax TaxID=13658 RepID=A0A915IJN6_ROMCU
MTNIVSNGLILQHQKDGLINNINADCTGGVVNHSFNKKVKFGPGVNQATVETVLYDNQTVGAAILFSDHKLLKFGSSGAAVARGRGANVTPRRAIKAETTGRPGGPPRVRPESTIFSSPTKLKVEIVDSQIPIQISPPVADVNFSSLTSASSHHRPFSHHYHSRPSSTEPTTSAATTQLPPIAATTTAAAPLASSNNVALIQARPLLTSTPLPHYQPTGKYASRVEAYHETQKSSRFKSATVSIEQSGLKAQKVLQKPSQIFYKCGQVIKSAAESFKNAAENFKRAVR